MIEKKNLEFLIGLEDKFLVVDALCYTLYGNDCGRSVEFKMAFLEAVEDLPTGKWINANGIGPSSVGYNLGAVWASKKWVSS